MTNDLKQTNNINNINKNIKEIEKYIENPTKGLPEEVFLFISRITPMVSVELLIKDENNRTLLSWRNDQIFGKGWHMPGGVVRLNETIENRVIKVSESEIGTNVLFDKTPIKMCQCILNQKERCHFISFLYKCYLSSSFVPDNKELTSNDNGYLMWHDKCPVNLLKAQKSYREYI